MLVHPIAETPIPARRVPDDFPEGLPEIPLTAEETYQLLELWDNLTGIARLRSEQWEDEKRCEYMVWMLDDGRQFRVMWDDEDGEFEIDVRRGHPR
ncbi:hypothetical protein HKK80_10730 [Halonotius sp. F2-221B]|uniref:hypothetical protein n=1 Tax=Halonotius sp. F2-221B TaxID=2731620 RepID=UPI00398AD338